uniref:Uncharacterized protein n=1 Tax=Glossina austeni TaxID=7395 RepID=A0A1A9VCG1_GLOAU
MPLGALYCHYIENYDIFPNVKFLDSEVFNAVCGQKSSCLPASDGVLSSVLISCADILMKPIKEIFNIYLPGGIFPDIWECSYILPLHKSGSRHSIENCRDNAKCLLDLSSNS